MGRNTELNEKMKDERRAKILSAALVLFATKGLAATRISDIAAEASMSQGLIYHYYRSKEEIFTALIRDAFKIMNRAVTALEDLDILPHEKIRRAVTELIGGLVTSQYAGNYYLLIATATASEVIPEEAKQIIRRENTIPYEVLTRIIRAGQKIGTIRDFDAEELSLVFWTSIKGLAIHKAAHGQNFKMVDPAILLQMFIV